MPTNSKLAGKMPLMMGLMGSAGKPVVKGAETVDFDGTNDALTKASDLTGATDGKTCTFSGWVYIAGDSAGDFIQGAGGIPAFSYASGVFTVNLRNAGGTVILDLQIAQTEKVPDYTWMHLLVSVDLANASNRHVYVNDEIPASINWVTYTDDNSDFTRASWGISSPGKVKGRLAHVYLDYAYINLSVEANRRNWITADLHPAAESVQSALSPILYLPMTDPDTAGTNAGTGGDFTLNGTVARSGRGPNQDNCSASVFDGSADRLYLSSPTGAAISKQAVVSFVINSSSTADAQESVYNFNNALYADYQPSDKTLGIQFKDAATTSIAARVTLNNFNANGITTHISVSIDVDGANTAKRHVYVNGVIYTDVTWNNFADISIAFTNTPWNIAAGSTGSPASSSYFEGIIGECYIDDVYIDLATDNPFWDSTLNKPVSVRKVIDDTGVTPLVALPMIGSDAGNNLGTGGDFTVNSGPFTGARGASEFWARSVDFDGSTDYYSRTSALSGASDGKVVNGFFAIRPDTVSGTENIFTIVNGSSERFAISRTTTNILIEAWNAAGSQILSATATATLALNTWAVIHFNFNLASSTNRSISKAGTNLSVSWGTFTDDSIELSSTEQYIGSGDAGGSLYGGDLAIMWLDFGTEIDFTDEATRLIYSDALGFPTDLQAAIDAGTSPQGIVHMKFDDSSAFGTNSGTGGVFTEAGTPVAGPDVNP